MRLLNNLKFSEARSTAGPYCICSCSPLVDPVTEFSSQLLQCISGIAQNFCRSGENIFLGSLLLHFSKASYGGADDAKSKSYLVMSTSHLFS